MTVKQKIDILIVCALKEEITPLLSDMHKETELKFNSGRLIVGSRGNNSIAISICGVGGKTAAQSLHSTLEILTPASVFIAGWAGALTDSLSICDLVLTETVFHWEDDENSGYSSNPDLNRKVKDRLNSSDITIKTGIQVTADKVVAKETLRNDLASRFKAHVVDMETSYLADILITKGLAFTILRVITDSADERIGIDFDKIPQSRVQRKLYWASHPGQYRKNIILLNNIRKATKELNRALNQILV